ncbi:MAG TPA: mycothiol system anti-sigma-R factor [Cryptosporangiaceae bacterium]|nr:mycothiol system anti-sigma-R factor [Cryptosporangiaceae bacterium]
MSCGQPHDADCTDVLAAVYLYLDSECDPTGREQIRQHLDECHPCLREFGIEQEVKTLVARCCGNDVAPDGLRQRLMAKIRDVAVFDVEGRVVGIDVEVTHAESTVTTVESESGDLPEARRE